MARARRHQAFDHKLYRHFAVLTIALTACIAMFANGEQTQQAAHQAAEIARTPAPDLHHEPPKIFDPRLPGNEDRQFGSAAGTTAPNVIVTPRNAGPWQISSQKRPTRLRRGQIVDSNGNIIMPRNDDAAQGGEQQPQPAAQPDRAWTQSDLNVTLRASMERSGRISDDIRIGGQ